MNFYLKNRQNNSMLDGASLYLLFFILNLCPVGGGYEVLESCEVINHAPSKFNLNAQKISDIIKTLAGLGYIVLKHFNSDEFCLIPTQKARVYEEEYKKERLKDKKLFKKMFLTGFLGGLIGALIGVIIMLMVGKNAF